MTPIDSLVASNEHSPVELEAKIIDQTGAKIAFGLVELTAALNIFYQQMEELEESGSDTVGEVERSAALGATKQLLAAIRSSGFQLGQKESRSNAIAARRNALTLRENQVLDMIIGGATSREGALAMEISTRTFEGHRAKLMLKLQAKNVADLVLKGFGRNIALADPKPSKREAH